MRTHIVSILDQSGSMGGLLTDILGGYNGFLEEQRGLALVEDTWSLTVFNDQVANRFSKVPLNRVPRLTPETFRPRGGTALYDAIGQTMTPWLVDLKENDRGILVIATDGEENSSDAFTLTDVQQLLKALEATGAWTIVYLGVEVSGFGGRQHLHQSRSSGIPQTNTLTHASANHLYGATSQRVAALRQSTVRATSDLYKAALPPAEDILHLGPPS